jgi:hypothetical protein
MMSSRRQRHHGVVDAWSSKHELICITCCLLGLKNRSMSSAKRRWDTPGACRHTLSGCTRSFTTCFSSAEKPSAMKRNKTKIGRVGPPCLSPCDEISHRGNTSHDIVLFFFEKTPYIYNVAASYWSKMGDQLFCNNLVACIS